LELGIHVSKLLTSCGLEINYVSKAGAPAGSSGVYLGNSTELANTISLLSD